MLEWNGKNALKVQLLSYQELAFDDIRRSQHTFDHLWMARTI